jgi:hypothetical protein
MAELSQALEAMSRKNYTTILRALAEAKQVNVAEAMGLSETTISRTDKEVMGKFLAACGLKVVPVGHKTYDAAYIDALRVMAGVGLRSAPDESLMEWDKLQSNPPHPERRGQKQ